MKRRLLVSMMALGGLMAGGVYGDIVAGNTMKLTAMGGDLDAPLTMQTTSGSFTTFCVELEEALYPPSSGAVYTVAAVGLSNTSGHSMTQYTAWLYSSFLAGSLAAYTDAQVQYAIWQSMGYSDSDVTGAYPGSWDDGGLATAFAGASWSGFGNVRVAQLQLFVSGVGYAMQDVLVESTVAVPVPGAALLVGLGLVAVSSIRRRLA